MIVWVEFIINELLYKMRWHILWYLGNSYDDIKCQKDAFLTFDIWFVKTWVAGYISLCTGFDGGYLVQNTSIKAFAHADGGLYPVTRPKIDVATISGACVYNIIYG